jgi:hypothetical protein
MAAAQLAPPPADRRPPRLAGRPRHLTVEQCKALVSVHLRQGASLADLAAQYRFNGGATALGAVLRTPFMQSLIFEVQDAARARVDAAYHVMQSTTLKAAQNVKAAVENGDMKASYYTLDWHARLQPQQLQVSGEVQHQHAVSATLDSALTKLTDALSQARSIPSMDAFLLKGKAAPDPATLSTEVVSVEGGAVTYAPTLSLDAPVPPAPKPVAPTQRSEPMIARRQADGSYRLGEPPR